MLWPLGDHQGTVRDLIDGNGVVRTNRKYDSFGKITAETKYDMAGNVVPDSHAEPIRHHNLTVFALAWPEHREPPYTLLATAIERGEAVVEEVDEDGEVPHLNVANHGDRPILVPEGEILVGAKQNRVVNVTVLVAAQSTFKVPVSCVEQGRWQYRTRRFRSEVCAPPSLRSKKMRTVNQTRALQGTAEGDQGEVWDEVDACLAGTGVESETASLTDGFEAAKERLQEYRDRLQLPDDAAGVVVASGDHVIGMDLFDSPATCATFRRSARVSNPKERERTHTLPSGSLEPSKTATEYIDRSPQCIQCLPPSLAS